MEHKKSGILTAGVVLGLTAGLFAVSLKNYLLFHALAEMFSVCVAFSVFIIAWNSREYLGNSGFLILGVAYLSIALQDIFHTLAYPGMNIFLDYPYYANQIWMTARFTESATLLWVFSLGRPRKPVSPAPLLLLYGLLTFGFLYSILVGRFFPVCFIEGQGLTPFKIYGEYVIILILLGALVQLRRSRNLYIPSIYRRMFLSVVLTVLSELAFTFYISNYDFLNMAGHYLKLFSFFTLYQALLFQGIRNPYNLIFRELKEKERMLSEQNSLLAAQSRTDGLTGMHNHVSIYRNLEREMERTVRHGVPLSIQLVDIDHFKEINDRLGHTRGDQVLKEIAGIIREALRTLDIPGRYGGEEFLVILPQTDLGTAHIAGERIRKLVEDHDFGDGLKVTISGGCAEFAPGLDKTGFVNRADTNLYRAKNQGRNRIL